MISMEGKIESAMEFKGKETHPGCRDQGAFE